MPNMPKLLGNGNDHRFSISSISSCSRCLPFKEPRKKFMFGWTAGWTLYAEKARVVQQDESWTLRGNHLQWDSWGQIFSPRRCRSLILWSFHNCVQSDHHSKCPPLRRLGMEDSSLWCKQCWNNLVILGSWYFMWKNVASSSQQWCFATT